MADTVSYISVILVFCPGVVALTSLAVAVSASDCNKVETVCCMGICITLFDL
jgi:hypothetical protein